MDPQTKLFAMALGLQSPWFINDVSFDESSQELHSSIDFADSACFSIPNHAIEVRPYDIRERTWRHLNF